MNVKKTLVSLLFIFSFLLFTPAVFAQGVTVTDDAGLFTAEEIAELTDLATDINQTIKGEVFIVTTTDNTQDPETFADDFLREQIGNDNNGSVLLLDMGQREIYISTSGNMIDYLTDSRIEQILDSVYEGMSEADYIQAARSYLTMSQSFIENGVPRGHYRVDRDTGKITYYNVLTFGEILFAIITAVIISGVVFFIVKSRYQMKSGTYTYPFLEQLNFKLSKKEDRLTNSFITTRRIPKPPANTGGGSGGGSTTHSSGGGTFGGGGRSF